MLKKTITYKDFDGNERTEDFYFNLTKAECLEWETSRNGGITKVLEKIVAEQDSKLIMEHFKDVILRSYGEKSLDGKHFVKNKEIRDAFISTEAYSDLFVLLTSDAEAAADFVNAILPEVPSNVSPIPAPSK